MKNIFFKKVSIILMISGAVGVCSAQTQLAVQSEDRPFNLDIVAPVMQAGSDESSSEFQEEDLPVLREFIDNNLSERSALSNIDSIALDPSQLTFADEADVRVYFLGEGAGYHNTLGFNAEGIGVNEGDPKLIFPDASSLDSNMTSGDTESSTSYRNEANPLLPGDFVDIGTFDAGTSLDFFLIANGANGGSMVWTAHDDLNSDNTQHVVSFAVANSPYLLIGFEDLYGGGDMDYNDIVFAVDIGFSNVQALEYLASPEPALIIQLVFSFVLLAFLRRRLNPGAFN